MDTYLLPILKTYHIGSSSFPEDYFHWKIDALRYVVRNRIGSLNDVDCQQMMVEARWPNMKFPEQLWDRSTWAQSSTGSRYGKMVDPNLASTNIDTMFNYDDKKNKLLSLFIINVKGSINNIDTTIDYNQEKAEKIISSLVESKMKKIIKNKLDTKFNNIIENLLD